MTNPHGIISVESVNSESIPTLTLADYAFSSSNNAGTADRGKDAKITFNTTTDTFAITVKNNADNSNSNDSMTIKTGITTFSTDVSMGGSNFVVPADMSAGTDGQVLKINGSGETYWDDASGASYTLPTAASDTLGGIKVGNNLSIDGSGVLSADNANLTHNVTIGNVGGNKYLFNGDTSDPQPTITLIKGMTYHFNLNVSGHPFHIQTSGNGYNSSYDYTDHSSYVSGYLTHSSGVSNSSAQGKSSGIVTFTVPYNSPDTLYYQCQYHSGMYGVLNIVDGSTSLPTASTTLLGGVKVGTNLSIDGSGVLSADNSTLTHNISIYSSNYVFNGKIGNSNPTITLIRGMTYHFNLSVSGHPFHIQKSSGAYSSNKSVTEHGSYVSGYLRHSDGDTDEDANGKTSGTLTFTVPYNTPSNFYYVCQYHSSMQGTFNLVDGGVSPATAADYGTIKIGYTESGKNYPLELSNGKAFVNVPWTDTVYSLPTAASDTLGGIKVGTNLSIDGNGVLSATDTNTTYSTATSSESGLIKIGYTESGKNYPVELSDGKAFVYVPWTDTDTNTTYSEATDSALGLIKIGYTESGKNYPVELSDGKAFVNVPWTDTDTTYTVGDGGLTQNNFTDSLKADVENAVLRTGDQTIGGNKTFSNNVIVTGDLTVNGTNTVINSTVLTVNDQHIVINDGGDDTSANGGGIILEGTSANKTILYDNTNTSWDFSEHVNLASGKEFKIADTSVLSATTLGSGVVSSSLTSVGTIATGVWQGTEIAHTYIDTGIAENKIVKVSATDVASGEYARFTATGLESVTAAELKTALNISSGSSLWSEGSTSGEIYYTDGNVGIGTNDPSARLEIRGSTNTSEPKGLGLLDVVSTNGNNPNFIRVRAAGTTTSGNHAQAGLCLESNYNGSSHGKTAFIYAQADSTDHFDTNLIFRLRSDANYQWNDTTEIMRLKHNGNVGIGENTPTARLHIKGANDSSSGNTMDLVNDSGDALFHVQNDGKVGIGTDGPSAKLHIYGDDSETSTSQLLLKVQDTIAAYKWTGIGLGGKDQISKSGIIHERISSSESYGRGTLHFCTNNDNSNTDITKNDARLSIKSDGSVGIGTTNPYKTLEIHDSSSSSTTLRISDSSYPKIEFLTGNTSTFGNSTNGHCSIGNSASGSLLFIVKRTGSERHMMLNKNGYLGVNCSPSASLQVKGINNNSNTNTMNLTDSSNNSILLVRNDGKIGMGNDSPTVKLDVTGDIKSSGTVTATNVVAVSDGSLKTNIQQLENSLDVIHKLKGVSYNWTDPDNHDDEIGLIAQDVEEVVPEVVRNLGNSNLKGIEYQKLTAILIEAVKELSGKLNELNNKVNN